MYVVQCVFQKIKFFIHVCYLIDFVDMKHTVYNFLKRTKLNFLLSSKKYHFIKVNSFKLFLLPSQKYPPYHPTFQRAILTKFPVQFNSICTLYHHCLHSFSTFSGSHFSLLWSIRRGYELTRAIFIWVS